MDYSKNFRQTERGFDLDQAIVEAGRCLLCHEPPCSKGCPAQTDPGTFIRKLRLRNITGAIRTIKENNILGGACALLCPAARLCEKECSACGIDRPIRIGMIQRFLIEHSWRTGFRALARPEARQERVAVVGAGPAGLSCATELAKQGYSVTVFEARPQPGGVLRYGVPAFRLPADFLRNELADIKSLGVEFKCAAAITGDKTAEKLLRDGYQAVFLAPGLWSPVRLNEKQKDLKGIFTSLDFLAALREGKFKAMAGFFKGKACAVMGGGSVAVDCARSALRLGARDVYLVYRRSWPQMPAEEEERLSALREGVHFLLLNQPMAYVTGTKGSLKGMRLIRTRLGGKDASGRSKPVEVKGSQWVLGVDAAIEALGYQAVSDAATWYPTIALNKRRLIVADEKYCRTSRPGIFAGGDIIRGPDLVVRAVRDGKTAARSIMEYLGKKTQSRSAERCLA